MTNTNYDVKNNAMTNFDELKCPSEVSPFLLLFLLLLLLILSLSLSPPLRAPVNSPPPNSTSLDDPKDRLQFAEKALVVHQVDEAAAELHSLRSLDGVVDGIRDGGLDEGDPVKHDAATSEGITR